MNKTTYTLMYIPRTTEAPQYWELRDDRGYRVAPFVYTNEEVLVKEREWNDWRMTPDGQRFGTSQIAYRYY